MPNRALEEIAQARRWAAPRAAYVHVPFCAHRCGYCSFTVTAGRDDLIEAYLTGLELELRGLGEPRPVKTLFLGGGTPTHLGAAQLARLLAMIGHWFPTGADHEMTAEANPADLDPLKIELLARHGVNRLSLGAQSFDQATLRVLERDHGPEQIARCVEWARPRVRSISLDLIFAVPGQTLAGWLRDVARAVALSPDHISTYGLTFEKGTQFWNRLTHGQLARADEELERAMYSEAIDRLAAAGYEQYEISNFARPGHRCRHNEVYWSGGSYYAAGPSAARYVDGRREMNHRSTTTWLKRVLAGESPVAESETLGPEDRARESAVFGLRRLRGIQREEFFQQTGYEFDRLLGPQLARCLSLGLLIDDGDRIQLTRNGLFVSDSIWPDFLRG